MASLAWRGRRPLLTAFVARRIEMLMFFFTTENAFYALLGAFMF